MVYFSQLTIDLLKNAYQGKNHWPRYAWRGVRRRCDRRQWSQCLKRGKALKPAHIQCHKLVWNWLSWQTVSDNKIQISNSDTGRGPLSIKARTYSVPRTLHKQHAGWVFVASALKDFIIMGIQLGYYGAAEISFFLSSLFVHDTKKDLEISFFEQVLKKTTNQISDHFIGESFHLLTLFVHPLSRNPSKWSGKAYSLPVKVAQAQEPFICRWSICDVEGPRPTNNIVADTIIREGLRFVNEWASKSHLLDL